MRTRRSLLVVLVGGATAAGCGGGGELSEQELRDQANQACREYAERVEGLEPPKSDEDLGSAIDEAKPAIDDLRSDLEDLEPPAELEEQYDKVVKGVKAAGARLTKLRDAAEDQNTERLQELVGEAAKAQRNADRAAQDLGLDECV